MSSRSISRVVLLNLPWLVVIAYAAVTAGYYSRYLNWNLEFVSPRTPYALEDVLGFGFLTPWALFALLLAVSIGIAYGRERPQRTYLTLLALGFVATSAIDLILFGIVRDGVLSQ